jgi:hypothetical protein
MDAKTKELVYQAGFDDLDVQDHEKRLERFAKLIRHDEREQTSTERNFCPRCGKRVRQGNHIHTCTPPLGEE